MATLKLIETANMGPALLTNVEVKPDQAWLNQLSAKPNNFGKWFRAYPLKGGAMLVQEGTFELLEKVASDAHIEEACTGGGKWGFNPAAKAIREYLAN